MNHLRRLFPLLFTVVMLALVLAPAHAATMTVRAGTVQASPGGTVEVPIEVVGAPGVGALQLELVYDPAVLTAQEVVKGPLLSNAMLESTVAPRGRAGLVFISQDPLKGDGIIAKVRFKVAGNTGQTSTLTLEKVQAWERESYRDIVIKTEAGRVTIATDFTMALLIAACCLLLLLLFGGGGLVLLLRRNRAPRAQYAPQPAYPSPPRPTDLPESKRPRPPTTLPR